MPPPATDVALHIRAMDATPGAWSELDGAQVKLFRPRVVPDHVIAPPPEPGPSGNGGPPVSDEPPAPGTVLDTDPAQGVLVATTLGGVLVTEVQPSGRRRMAARDWINGRGVEPGQRFE